MERTWTKAQSDAIQAGKGPVLVSAAAGSGKTSVLVERAIRLICGKEEPIDVDRLLVVTYTNAAAAEMKQRIGQRLADLSRRQPGNLRLLSQQALLAGASIGTIHAFCLELIRQNFQHLSIAHDFVMANEGELAILREESAREVIERFYLRDEEMGGRFLALVELLSTSRDDSRLVEVMLRLYDFARSHPFYLDWLDEMETLYHSCPPIEDTAWGRSLLQYAADTLDYCVASMGSLQALIGSDDAVEKAYGDAISSDLEQLLGCREVVAGRSWDEAVICLSQLSYARLKPLKGNDDIKARVQGVRKRCRKQMDRLSQDILNATREDFVQDMADLNPKLSVLFDLVRAFDRVFTEKKAQKKRLDFSDLEHLALSLLAQPGEDGIILRKEQAIQLSQRYDQVLVDEYQDVNEVQETIFACVSRQQTNLFMVGDAKQSIYSFRLATPQIFLSKKESYSAYAGEDGPFPAKISLDVNFRSRKEVTDGVNYLFGLLMSRSMGDIQYEGEELLRCGAEYPTSDRENMFVPELLLLDGGESEEDTALLEARMIARRIASMIEEQYPVTGKDAQGNPVLRPCQPGDFCILMRSPKRRQQTYLKALEAEGLPVWAQNADGFLSLREIQMVLSLLQALDNPLLDLPLVAALLSPLFGFSDTDIAAIRLAGQGLSFYLALQEVAKSHPNQLLSRRSTAFLETFSTLRQRAAVLPVDRLLLEIYTRTDALALVEVMPMGESRRANLLLLVEYASQYHDLGYKQLGGFVGFLDRLRERGGDLAPALGAGEQGSAVRIMSVHRSKGLEFPIVILADTARQFNRSDLNQSYQLHSRYGFACCRRDPDTLKQYATLPMEAIRLESRKDLLGEELRILYVALTRAQEKLIITGCVKSGLGRRLENAAGDLAEGKLNPRALEEARSPLDWVLATLLHHPDGEALRRGAGSMDSHIVKTRHRWNMELLTPESPEETASVSRIPHRTAQPDEAMLKLLQEQAAWQYPYHVQTRMPTKLAVSELAGKKGAGARFAAAPRFLEGRGLTAAQRGSALHKFMQFADYHQAKADLEGEIQRMGKERYLTLAETESLSRKKLHAFFHGSLANRIFASPQVWRELRFLGEYGRDVLGDYLEEMDDAGDITIQGVADCVFVEEGKAVIVDYKTDAASQTEELLERYRVQLSLYRHILSQALPVPVGECIIYSFSLEKEIVVV